MTEKYPPAPAPSDRDGRLVSPPAVLELGLAPDLLRLHVWDAERYPFLLESSGGPPGLAQFDILLAFPGDALTLDAQWRLSGPGTESAADGFLAAFDRWWGRCRHHSTPIGLPFAGGWFVFMAYEMAMQIEPSIDVATDPRLPVAAAIRIPAAIIRECSSGRCFAVAERGAESVLPKMASDFTGCTEPRNLGPVTANLLVPGSLVEEDSTTFLDAVERVKHHIRAGDVYQANICRRWRGRLGNTAGWMLYERLRRANPAPFAGLMNLGDAVVLSSSPERLIRIHGGRVETRPIAGTRPRGACRPEDDASRSELLASPKERAEHVMLIDLERSDLGRICRPGSIRVDELMAVETYAHVHHIVSNVSGELRPDVTPGAALQAVFPGGTITGCPKVRCMRIIHEMERYPRGAYTGTMGYVNHDGSGDFNILIRSITVAGRELTLNAGSGIVWDSVPELELEETRAKAKGLLLSLVEPPKR